MPFFKDLRRKKTVSKIEKSFEESNSSESNGTGPVQNKSSSTLNSVYNGTSTPASSVQPNQSSPNLPSLTTSKSTGAITTLHQRPVPLTSVSNRSSFMGLNTPSINGTLPPKAHLSTYAPRVLSVSDNSWVHQNVLLVYGHIGDPREKVLDGNLTVCHHHDNFPATSWPVSESYFKALVHLTPGPNRLRFDFSSPKLTSNQSSLPNHCSWMNINLLPLVNSPPLQLAILLARDSPGLFDAVPERKQREGNDLEAAVKKLRMAAYLWQAFSGEQMYRQGFGRRCFRFEEDWQTGSLTFRDKDMGTMRNEAKVHIIRSRKTVRELRGLSSNNPHGSHDQGADLLSTVLEDLQDFFKPRQGQKLFVSTLLLDTHWDTLTRSITGHAAMSGGADNVKLALFGSQALQSYPACIEEVVPAFMDCTRTDVNFIANEHGESGSNWEAANMGIGAHLRETGRMLGLPLQESGVMGRDWRLNRTFLCREPFSTTHKSPGIRLILPKDECGWHRLDTLRFKYHPCFQLPTDAPLKPDESIQIWPTDGGKIIVTASTGIAFVEIYADDDQVCRAWIEYGNGDVQAAIPPRQVVLTEDELRDRLTHIKKPRNLRIVITSASLGRSVVENVLQLFKAKSHIVKLPNGKSGFQGCNLGSNQQPGTQPQQVLLETAFVQTKLLTSIKVYHGVAIDGLEFLYEDSTSQLFGNREGKAEDFTFGRHSLIWSRPSGSCCPDTRRGEILFGFYVRASSWIDGLEILTSLGRRSGIYGNPKGGSGCAILPPTFAFILQSRHTKNMANR